jgi:hypothetical protein
VAVRVLNLTTGGNVTWINHGNFNLMMDCIGRMFLANVNTDSKKEIILINTVYSGPAIKVWDIFNDLSTIQSIIILNSMGQKMEEINQIADELNINVSRLNKRSFG